MPTSGRCRTVTGQRARCPTGDLTGERHVVGDRRWLLTTPDGQETALCSPCCVIMWAAYALPADIEACDRGTSQEPAARAVRFYDAGSQISRSATS